MRLARLARRDHQNHCNFPECPSVQFCARTVTESVRCMAGLCLTNERKLMKKLFALALSLSLLGGLSPALLSAASADNGGKKHPKAAEERRKTRKEMLEKYDTNKNGKLDKQERARISKEDQEKLEKAGLGRHARKGEKTDKKESSK